MRRKKNRAKTGSERIVELHQLGKGYTLAQRAHMAQGHQCYNECLFPMARLRVAGAASSLIRNTRVRIKLASTRRALEKTEFHSHKQDQAHSTASNPPDPLTLFFSSSLLGDFRLCRRLRQPPTWSPAAAAATAVLRFHSWRQQTAEKRFWDT
eukprot:1162143-Pelagomonas_calceolata.AAC.40